MGQKRHVDSQTAEAQDELMPSDYKEQYGKM